MEALLLSWPSPRPALHRPPKAAWRPAASIDIRRALVEPPLTPSVPQPPPPPPPALSIVCG